MANQKKQENKKQCKKHTRPHLNVFVAPTDANRKAVQAANEAGHKAAVAAKAVLTAAHAEKVAADQAAAKLARMARNGHKA